MVAGSLMNVAALVADGEVVGIVPKTFLPTYREFYEGRHFRGGSVSDPATVELFETEIPFGTDLLFRWGEATIAIEICEDLWTPIPPSSLGGGRRRECAVESVGQQRNDRQGCLASRSGPQPIGTMHRGLRVRFVGAGRIDFGFGVWRPLLDRRKRRHLGRIATRRRWARTGADQRNIGHL